MTYLCKQQNHNQISVNAHVIISKMKSILFTITLPHDLLKHTGNVKRAIWAKNDQTKIFIGLHYLNKSFFIRKANLFVLSMEIIVNVDKWGFFRVQCEIRCQVKVPTELNGEENSLKQYAAIFMLNFFYENVFFY